MANLTLVAQRKRLKEYMRSPGTRPFIIDRADEYCVCEVLFPTVASEIRFHVRFFLAWLISWFPHSDVKIWLARRMGARIGNNVYIAPGVLIDPYFPWLIEIEDECFLGLYCRLFTHEYTASNFRLGPVKIKRGAVVGAHSTIRSGVTVGESATVGFDSLVNHDVPDRATVGGVPAKILKNENGCE